jgi:phage tail-like protein
MDANGTRYHLLLGKDDWTRRMDPPGSSEYDPAREELTLRPREFLFAQRQGDRPPRLTDRRGVGRDASGNVYWIAPDRTSIRVRSVGNGTTSLYWQPGLHSAPEPDRDVGVFAPSPETGQQPPPVPAIPLAGLAVTEDHYLVVGTLDPAGILVFDLHSPGPPRQELWPPRVSFHPFDLCARAGGGVFVLDRDARRLWELDRRFLVVSRRTDPDEGETADFRPADGEPEPEAPREGSAHRRIEAGDAVFLGGDPIAVEPAPGGRLIVLDRNEDDPPSTVRLLAQGKDAGPTAPLEETPIDVEVVAHDMALVRTGAIGTLYVVDRLGNQSFAFELTLMGETLQAALAHEYFPMRLFGGKGLVASPGGAMYDFGDGWIPLARQNHSQFEVSSTLYGPVFDSRLPGTVWHRLLLDACIPAETSVAVESRAADDERELDVAPWQPEPALTYRRADGSELPFAASQPSPEHHTWEMLFQRARGRYLQLRLALAGDGRTSPRLRALRAYYPRFSYLERYLPKVYRDDVDSAAFLDRFLANFEGIQTGIEDRMAAARALFDPRTAPAEALDWLMSWFDFVFDPTWHEERRRLFLRHGVDFFALRGTVPGIQLALRLALDPCDGELFEPRTRDYTSRIVERFRARRTPPVVLGDPTELTGPRIVPAAGPRWEPTQGGDLLRDRWRAFSGDDDADFPPIDSSEQWRAFVRDVLGIQPPDAFDPAQWATFLTARYGRIEVLDAAYGLVGDNRHASFADVGFPTTLSPDGAPLRDWYQFLAVALPARRAAHRFTVLLPVPHADDEGWSPDERREIALRVVELQKPAHTTFDVKFFWAAFRLGEVRLGEDTLLDLGSRDPRLREPVVLGREHTGESYLGGDPAPVAGHVGRDPLNR